MPRKGREQYTNPVRRAIETSSGRAMAGTRAAASSRIVRDSELRKAFQPRERRLMTTSDLYRRLGISERNIREGRVYTSANRNSIRTIHRSDRRDPNTGFGMNVRTVNRYTVITGS